MKIIAVILAVFSLGLPALADTYTGVVSEVKHFAKGGVAVDMDGEYPNQKMVLYVPKNSEGSITLPPVGVKVTATGTASQYEGHPEIKIYKADQWKW